MSDEWISVDDLTVPDDLYVAVGKVALAFAAVHNNLAILLHETGASNKTFEELCGDGFDTILKNVNRLLEQREIPSLIPVERLSELSMIRNDLMQGLAFLPIEAPVTRLHLWNPFRDRTRWVSAEELSNIAREVDAVAKFLPEAIYDIIHAPSVGSMPTEKRK